MLKSRLFSIFILIALIAFSFAFAQEKYPTGKGSMLLSGSLSFYTQVSPSDGATEFTLSPSLLYFFMDKLGAGPDLSFTYHSEGGESNTAFGAGLKLGYFLSKPESKFTPFIAAGFKYISPGDGSYFQIKGGPGVGLSLGTNGVFSLQAGYQMDMMEGQTVGNIFLEGGLGIFLF
ncbi:MAG: hypothetical protein ABIK97_01610 [candidate division WOR-3 bacterium]